MTALADRLAALEARLAKLEQLAAGARRRPDAASANADADAQAAASYAAASSSSCPVERRLAEELYAARAYRAPFTFKRVEPDYYDQPLEGRRAALSADSVSRLCKTIVLENTRADAAVVPEGAASSDPLKTRYYMVVFQYCRRLNADKLGKQLCALFAERGSPMGKKNFNLRLCPADASARLTGFQHNAVTPVGSASPLAVVLSHHLLELPPDSASLAAGAAGAAAASYFWMGGGDVDLKLRVSAAGFARAYGATVLDCTYDEVLTPGEEGGD